MNNSEKCNSNAYYWLSIQICFFFSKTLHGFLKILARQGFDDRIQVMKRTGLFLVLWIGRGDDHDKIHIMNRPEDIESFAIGQLDIQEQQINFVVPEKFQ